MTTNLCPVCSSEKTSSSSVTKQITVDYYQSFSLGYDIQECHICGFSGSDEETTDEVIENERKISNAITLKSLIDQATSEGQRASFIERAFKLPPRTLNRWKNQGGSAAAVALLKLVNTYGWLPKVAENGYYPEYAKLEQYKQAGIQFANERKSVGASQMIAITKTSNNEGHGLFAMASTDDSLLNENQENTKVTACVDDRPNENRWFMEIEED